MGWQRAQWKTLVLVSILVFGATGLNACAQPAPAPQPVLAPTPPPPPSTAPQPTTFLSIDIAGFAFSTADITVPIGAKVIWTNKDTVTHTVTSLAAVFDSGDLRNGATFSHIFKQTGTFQYRCDIHRYMTAKVIVGGETAAPSGGSTGGSTSGNLSGNSSGASDYNYGY